MLNHRRIQFGPDAADEDGAKASQLWCGDSAELLQGVEDDSLDMVYIDPPFGTGTTRRGGEAAGDKRGKRSYRDRPDAPEPFVEWLSPCLEHSRRVLNKTGSLFVHLDYRSVHYVKVHLDALFGRARFVNEIIWCYSVGGKSRRTFGRKHDTILWYAKSPNYAFYPEAVHVPRKPSTHMRIVIDENGEEVQEKTDKTTGKVYRYPVKRGKIPEDWWTDIETLNRSDKERTGWPTQKPQRLLERLIKATTDEGDWVGDWFSGSGTTAAVAQRLGRSFIAMDRSSEAVSCAAERLQAQGERLAAEQRPPSPIEVRG